MEIVYHVVEGSQKEKPKEIDMTSTSKLVYLRRNIEWVTKEDPLSNEPYECWEYEEAILNKDEFEEYVAKDVKRITPYTATKTAYIEDTEITFTDVPNGNLTVSMVDTEGNYPNYTVSRSGDRITLNFEPLQKVTTVTISVL